MCDIRIFCNACGKELYMENNILKEDAFEAKKQWGYFSKKILRCIPSFFVKNVMIK